MSRIFVHGCGVVSPAGWGLDPFWQVLEGTRAVDPATLAGPEGIPWPVRRVPNPAKRPAWCLHPRLRRAGMVSHYAVAAAFEALGSPEPWVPVSRMRMIVCVMCGGIQHSRRFFTEVLADPSTASPMLFPETVFNAPASHLGALLDNRTACTTCVSDESGFVTALGTAAEELVRGTADTCLVVASEELDWVSVTASRHFPKALPLADGAAAVWLSRKPGPVELVAVTEARPFVGGRKPVRDLAAIRHELGSRTGDVTFASGVPSHPQALEPRLGNGQAAAGGWASIAAIEAVRRGRVPGASAVVIGANHQAIGAGFARAD